MKPGLGEDPLPARTSSEGPSTTVYNLRLSLKYIPMKIIRELLFIFQITYVCFLSYQSGYMYIFEYFLVRLQTVQQMNTSWLSNGHDPSNETNIVMKREE